MRPLGIGLIIRCISFNTEALNDMLKREMPPVHPGRNPENLVSDLKKELRNDNSFQNDGKMVFKK